MAEQGSPELPVQTLDQTVCLWVIWCGHLVFGAEEFREPLKNVRTELPPLIGRDSQGYTESCNPMVQERVSDRVGRSFFQRNGFRVSRETVDNCETVAVLFR
uniref:Uncharacterized protein n=1 Tax=Bracon brevicornis TaxID=1563983 RepID=A0A6V7KLT8_9HYME